MKLDRIEQEQQRIRTKIVELQNRLKELDGLKAEQENLQIVQIVRAMRLSPQELTEFLKRGAIPPKKKIEQPKIKQEDTQNEE